MAVKLFENFAYYDKIKLRWEMAHLINRNDKDVIASGSFVKNAVFYKDMLAFYDAYKNLMETSVSKLPSFCYKKGTYYLEGICLLFRDYSSELGFESIKLSLDYLKVIYYTIASYSEDGELPEKEILLNEFNVYKNASAELAVSVNAELKQNKENFDAAKKEYDGETRMHAKHLISARLCEGVSIVLFILTVLIAMLGFTFHFMGKFTFSQATIWSISVLVVGFSLFGLLKFSAKKHQSKSNGLSYETQAKKKKKDDAELEYVSAFERANKINSEKYEYNSNFSEELKKYVKVLSFEEIIDRASDYKMLSYNMKLDLQNLFASQEQEIREIIEVIGGITNPDNANRDFEKIYAEIESKDWLYYNNEVRFEFIKRMADVSEFTYNYSVKSNGKKVNPFGISVKSLSKEPIVYLKSNEDLFISATLDKFLNTRYIKNTKTLELKGLKSSDALKLVKMEFASHFFDYENTIKYNNLFYETKIQDGVKIPEDIIENNRKVPTYVYMKLKLIESKLKMGNSDASTIAQLAKVIERFEATGNFEKIAIENADMFENENVTSEVCTYEDLGYAVKYTFEDGSFIGYRLSNKF